MQLKQLLQTRIRDGIHRQSLISPSRYAEATRVMGNPFPGPWTVWNHPWLREIMDCPADLMVAQKAAQMGVTEAALNKVFHVIDYKSLDVMYVLPTKRPDASDFSSGRFDPALELSPKLKALFSSTDNVDHKRAGSANLYVRGSRSRSQLKSVPINFIVLDELDEMAQGNIPLAMERTSGQKDGTFAVWMISTPTLQGMGINAYFKNSTQSEFYFPCPGCSKMINLEYPRNFEIIGDNPQNCSGRLFCHECGFEIHHGEKPKALSKGVWVPKYTDRNSHGFHINQLYSCALSANRFAVKALKAREDAASEQEFFNSALGKPHEVEGARVTDAALKECQGEYLMHTPNQIADKRFVTMGVDVGDLFHIEITEWYWERLQGLDTNVQAIAKVLWAGTVKNIGQVDHLMQSCNIRSCVIDLNPERRIAREFANRWYGRVFCCEYPVGQRGRNITQREDDSAVMVDRTSWLDLSLGRFHPPHSITLPKDIPTDYKEQQKALVRIYERDKDGNPFAKYVKGPKPDHFAHARNYAEIAFTLGCATAGNRNMGSPR